MFFPDYSFVTLVKDKSIAFILPDHTGLVYKADNDLPIHTYGHWSQIKKVIADKKLEPIANIVESDNGLCAITILDKTLNVSTGSKLKIQLEKMLGLDMNKPIADQKIGVINKCIYFIGQDKTLNHCRAMGKLQTELGFISTMGQLNPTSESLTPVEKQAKTGFPTFDVKSEPVSVSGTENSDDKEPSTKNEYKKWLSAKNVAYRAKANLQELAELYLNAITEPEPVNV